MGAGAAAARQARSRRPALQSDLCRNRQGLQRGAGGWGVEVGNHFKETGGGALGFLCADALF